jgi:hypothetical protein
MSSEGPAAPARDTAATAANTASNTAGSHAIRLWIETAIAVFLTAAAVVSISFFAAMAGLV